MSSILPLVVLLVLAVPVILVAGLITLNGRVKDLTAELEWLRDRLTRAEADLLKLKEGRAYPSPEASVTSTLSETAAPAAAQILVRRPAAAAEIPKTVPPIGNAAETLAPSPVFAAPPQIREVAPQSAVQGASAPQTTPAFETAGSQELPPLAAAWPRTTINWEQFMGVKLFAWLGGFALFLGIAFFIKYSFDRNLIPPELRAAIGFVIGLGLVGGGVLMKRRRLAVTSQTLCATGVVILYAVTFACRSIYHFGAFGPVTTFLLMALITAGAFTLAVRLEAQVVAILGLVGGFLTPFLLSTHQDNPVGLFSYIALLDLGLMAVAFRRRWSVLMMLAAVGTVLLEISWVAAFFAPAKLFTAMAVFLGFDFLFLLAFWAGEKMEQPSEWLTGSAIGLPFVTFGLSSTCWARKCMASVQEWFSPLPGERISACSPWCYYAQLCSGSKSSRAAPSFYCWPSGRRAG